jgi:hypothetical protein
MYIAVSAPPPGVKASQGARWSRRAAAGTLFLLDRAAELGSITGLQVSRIDAERIAAGAPDNIPLRWHARGQVIRDAMRRRTGPDTGDGEGPMPLPVNRSGPWPTSVRTGRLIDCFPETLGDLIDSFGYKCCHMQTLVYIPATISRNVNFGVPQPIVTLDNLIRNPP